MKRKLMTWEAFEEKLEPDSDVWYEDGSGYVKIEYNGMIWWISSEKKKLFGTEVEVEKIGNTSYTHIYKNRLLHELWFEPEYKPIEFITEEEFSV